MYVYRICLLGHALGLGRTRSTPGFYVTLQSKWFIIKSTIAEMMNCYQTRHIPFIVMGKKYVFLKGQVYGVPSNIMTGYQQGMSSKVS